MLGRPLQAESMSFKQVSYGFRTYEAIETSPYHNLGALPEPDFTRKILVRRLIKIDVHLYLGHGINHFRQYQAN